jgi:hypothetical protein
MAQFWLQIGLIGFGAGAASALLFASVLSGSILSVVLFYLAPLPVLIAAIGWSHWAGLAAALTAALGLALAFGTFFFPAFLISVGLHCWPARPHPLATSNGTRRAGSWCGPRSWAPW